MLFMLLVWMLLMLLEWMLLMLLVWMMLMLLMLLMLALVLLLLLLLLPRRRSVSIGVPNIPTTVHLSAVPFPACQCIASHCQFIASHCRCAGGRAGVGAEKPIDFQQRNPPRLRVVLSPPLLRDLERRINDLPLSDQLF
jgi:hypothetical protein